ncbi:ABC transporter permease [Geovibrio ferrireducens]|jgi:ABC-type multidrug transport system permease subunit|uniref:ABC transporter permease n=1 Tax=Geovibrio ferrireducens TaxID=46201 RepID=UPI002246BFB1|nr:ABC transporter permease [Geovibrio ferrireducens]
MNGIKGVLYRETRVLRSRFWKVLVSSAVSPFLFLLAFGYGIGRFASVDGVNYLTFLIPGLIAMSSLNQSYGISGEINISRFYFKVFDEYLLAPVSRWEIVAGEMLYGVIKGLIPVGIILLYGVIAGAGLKISPMFVPVMFVHLVVFSLLGIIVALVVKNHGDQMSVNTFVITPMIFLSGTFYPVDKMPLIAKLIAHISPLTYSTQLIRCSLIGTECDVLLNMGVMLTVAAVLFITAGRILKGVEG